jgi:hypothetical protein
MKKTNLTILLISSLLLMLLVAVLVKSFNHKDFQPDARKWAAASVDGSNVVQAESLNTQREKLLIIDLDKSDFTIGASETMNIAASEILEKNNLKKIRKFNGKVAIVAEDKALKARVWMILSQTGIRHLYILE